MPSLNFAILGPPFTLQGNFHVILKRDFQPDLLHEEVVECGSSMTASDLKAMIAKAHTLHFVDFGNGLVGIYAKCSDFDFCAVPQRSPIAQAEQESDSDKDSKELF